MLPHRDDEMKRGKAMQMVSPLRPFLPGQNMNRHQRRRRRKAEPIDTSGAERLTESIN
jgi:hypothetical protein